MGLKFGTIPEKCDKNTIIIAGGTISCKENNNSYFRRVDQRSELRNGESFIILSLGDMLSLWSGEIKENRIKLSNETKLEINPDDNETNNKDNKVVPFEKRRVYEKNLFDFSELDFYINDNSFSLVNIDENKNINFEPIKRGNLPLNMFRGKLENKLKDKIKDGLNIIIMHEPLSQPMKIFGQTEYFIVKVLYRKGKDIYRVHNGLFFGVSKNSICDENDLFFEISENGLNKIEEVFDGNYIKTSLNKKIGSFEIEKTLEKKCIRNSDGSEKQGLFVERVLNTSVYLSDYGFSFQNITSNPDGIIDYGYFLSSSSIASLKQEATDKNVPILQKEKLQQLSDPTVTIIDTDTMKNVTGKDILESNMRGDFIFLKPLKNVTQISIFEINDSGAREIFDINLDRTDSNRDKYNFLNITQNVLSYSKQNGAVKNREL